jgi:hypothetical protein
VRGVKLVAIALITVLVLASCVSHTHVVGDGAQTGQEVSAKQWYAVWGLIPLGIGGGADTAEMAAGASDYTITTEYEFIDVVANIFLQYVTLNIRTVTVTK